MSSKMIASNVDSVYDFGFTQPPKKQVTTYGKAGRRKANAARPALLRHAESAPAIPTSFAGSRSSSPEPPGLSSRTVSSTTVKQQSIGKYGSGARQKPVEKGHSQPLRDVYDIESEAEEEPTRTKKRRVAREPSNSGRFTGPYSTPDSSPGSASSPGPPAAKEASKSRRVASPPTASRRRTPERDISAEHDVAPLMPFSVRTSRTLKNLSVGSKGSRANKQQIPIRLSVQPSSKPVPKTSRPPIASTSAEPQLPVVPRVRKRRLIDTLAAQAEKESMSSEEEPSSQKSEFLDIEPPPALQSSSPPTTSSLAQQKPIARPALVTRKTGPKFTYSQQRSMLADDDPLLEGAGFENLGGGSTGGALFNFGRLTKSSTINTFSYLDEDEETANPGAVRSIHELRQAGANSRFADEMDDILDRVGSPSDKTSSLRRGALLEVAQKMKHKDFRLQFRNHSDGESLFKSLGNETDLVSGYAILAIITTLLACTTSGLLIQRLRAQGLATLVSKLLEHTADIVELGKDRTQNVSRNGQLTLAAIKSSILGLPVWEPFSPTSLSPRTLALKCLDLLMRQPTHASAEDELLFKAVTDRLFSILADGVSNSACWDLPNQQESYDFYIALYVLEAHSVSAMQSSLRSTWTKQYAPITADVLETALKQPTEQLGDLASLILRIALNVTNHNGEASQLFVDKGLLTRLANSACGAFGMVVNSMKVDSFMSKVLESLIMMLGAMINFCVYYPPASNSLEERGDGAGSPLNELIRIFADNHSKTAEADSMEKTQLNVALGYLAILLGYLCLSDSIRDRFVAVHPKRNIQPLINSLNEFIAFHRKVAEAQSAESSESGSLARLQNLADQLSALR